jgi:hypothetical protein
MEQVAALPSSPRIRPILFDAPLMSTVTSCGLNRPAANA